ncbi:hypothetical protein COY23_03480 [bacterium (Candidatus Torokbacteria) CG_4_10_14_0_2_um_filter_35_8]|nr:MAG: hypothetical protein COY23_03480 [bacterium (Candidatus Torokbacteria) CG_4_10_14_0_2_um_filter_35_8]
MITFHSKNPYLKFTDKIARYYGFLIVVILALIFVSLFYYLSYLKYQALGFDSGDLAIFNQVMWNTVRGSFFHSSILGHSYLGEHFSLFLIFLAPIYIFSQSPLCLLFLKCVFVGFSCIPLYLICRKILNDLLGILVVISYLIYPALGWASFHEFSMKPIALFFILLSIYYFFEKNYKKYVISGILALLCKETVAIAYIIFSLYAFFAKRKRGLKWHVIPFLFSAAWLIATIFFIIPSFNNLGYYKNSMFYAWLGQDIIVVFKNIFSYPVLFLRQVFNQINLRYLLLLFLPILFISLLSPALFIVTVAILFENLLSSGGVLNSSFRQYSILFIPFIFLGFTYGLKRIFAFKFIQKRETSVIIILLFLIFFTSSFFSPQLSIISQINYYKNLKNNETTLAKKEVLNIIPTKDAKVIASQDLETYLSSREEIYPFHYLYTGITEYGLSEFTSPKDIEYLLINTQDYFGVQVYSDVPWADNRLRSFLSEGDWGIREVKGPIVLIQRNYKDQSKFVLWESIDNSEMIKTLAKTQQDFEGNIKLLGYDMEEKKVKKGESLKLSCFWSDLRKKEKEESEEEPMEQLVEYLQGRRTENYEVLFEFINKENEVAEKTIYPVCYRIFPTSEWKTGEIVKVNYSLLVPEKLEEGRYRLRITMVEPKYVVFNQLKYNMLDVSGVVEENSDREIEGVSNSIEVQGLQVFD